jgi:hypothetical protein
MSFLRMGLNLRPLENWPQIETKAASMAFLATEASFYAVSNYAGTRHKLLKQHDLAHHEPDT